MISPAIGLCLMLSVTWLKVPPPTQKNPHSSGFMRIDGVEHGFEGGMEISLLFSGHKVLLIGQACHQQTVNRYRCPLFLP